MLKKLNILESIRGGAALYVFVSHFMLGYFINRTNKFSLIFSFGQEAVILFFLMSGFVINLSYSQKNISFWEYFKKRFLRIYPLFFLSILFVISYILISDSTFDIQTLIGNLLMLQDMGPLKPGTIVDTFGNSALWSLSYEWWFYMMFIPIYRSGNKKNISIFIVVLSSLLYFVFPIQLLRWLLYFGIWWSGALLAELYLLKSLSFKKVLYEIIFKILLFPTLLLFLKFLKEPFVSIGIYPTLELRHFASAIFFILVAVLWREMKWFGYFVFKPLEKIAPFSYGLYVLHLPIIVILDFIFLNKIDNKIIQFTITFVIVISISYFSELILQKKLINFIIKKTNFGK